MLVSKIVRIEFADPRIRAVDALRDLRDAAKFISLNLYSRYDVQLQTPMVSDSNMVTLEIKIPEQIVHSFGNRKSSSWNVNVFAEEGVLIMNNISLERDC